MRDFPVILGGLAAFLAMATLPFWYNAVAGKGSRRLDLKKPVAAKQCVAPVEVMRRTHMEMLIAWRDRKVRDGIRTVASADGQVYQIALTRTCLEQCHGSKAEFCDRCHSYVGLKGPDCWSCHANAGQDPILQSLISSGRPVPMKAVGPGFQPAAGLPPGALRTEAPFSRPPFMPRTRVPAGLAGPKAGCGQDCPPHIEAASLHDTGAAK